MHGTFEALTALFFDHIFCSVSFTTSAWCVIPKMIMMIMSGPLRMTASVNSKNLQNQT